MKMPLLELNNVSFAFRIRQGLFKPHTSLRAVENVQLSIAKAETLALVGESGCGKSTLGRLVIGNLTPASGRVLINSKPIGSLTKSARARLVQPIVQNPATALDPRWTVRRLLEEPFRIHKNISKDRDHAILDIMDATRLATAMLDRFPHELSGGQLQRVAIARALLLQPALLVCDEAVSALDAAIQADIIALLKSIQHDFQTSIIFITHDLNLAPSIADRIAVMYLGSLVEVGPADKVGDQHSHPYTKALFGAAPQIGRKRQKRATLNGEPPDPIHKPQGCAFHPRCPVAIAQCSTGSPTTIMHDTSHTVSCHLVNFEESDQLAHTQAAQ